LRERDIERDIERERESLEKRLILREEMFAKEETYINLMYWYWL